MRRVPFNRLMIQPQVHGDWFARAGGLYFELDRATAEAFATLWQAYEADGRPAPAPFLTQHSLAEDDALFALFAAIQRVLESEPRLQVTPEPEGLSLSRAAN